MTQNHRNRSVKGWKGFDGENDMTDQDWLDRAGRLASNLLNGIPQEDCVPDEDGLGTNGVYNDDYSPQEHMNAWRQYEEDPEHAETVDN